jgi:hypothetical protein
MHSPDSSSVTRILREAAEFTRRVGAESEAAELEKFCTRFQTEKATLKLLLGPVDKAMTQALRKIRAALFDERRQPKPGTESLTEEYARIWGDFARLILSSQKPEMNISKFAMSEHVREKVVSYEGEASGVRPVVEQTIALVRRYSQLLGAGDFKAAYQLTDTGLRRSMDFNKFVREHERAAQHYHGPALEFRINQFAYVYADDAARNKSNTAEEGWPKLTPKENRRGRVLGFWIRDRAANTGCGGALWIAEESGEYRIAKFDFWRP